MSGEVGSTSPVLGTRFATTAQQHLRILKQYKRIAMVGLSANPYRPSHFAALYMKAAGYQIFPVNPREREILGRHCYATLAEVPTPLEIVDIFARALEAGLEVVMDRCVKIEHARFFGGLSTLGLNAGVVSARKPGG